MTIKKGGTILSNSISNFPPAKANRELQKSGDFVSTTINSLMELSKQGKPKNEAELKERINDYFSFCSSHNFRVGIESLSLSLGCTRACFWNWCNGQGVSDEWADICKQARQCVVAFVETATISGKLSPPIGIFCLKNLASWKDTVSFEDLSPAETDHVQGMKAIMLPKLINDESEVNKFENL